MRPRRLARLAALAAIGALGACRLFPHHEPEIRHEPPRPAVVVAPAPPPRTAHMICRNSQDGRKVECGTPNAVMVGMKVD